MKTNNKFSIKDSHKNKIQRILAIIELIKEIQLETDGFVSCFYNTIPVKMRCPKCMQGKRRSKSKIFKHPKAVAHHLVKEHSSVDRQEYPTLEQSLKLVEVHSIILQLNMVQV